MSDIIITPNRGSSNAPTIQFSGSANASASIRLEVLPEGQVAFLGKSGSLFSISDNMVGSLMAVSDISGLPILEVFSDDKVIMGKYNTNTLVVTGSQIGVGKSNPSVALDVSGSVIITGSLRVSTSITSSLFGTASYATTASYVMSGGSGSSGTSGANGANGSSGTSGATGANGSSGTSGSSGAAGAGGSSGTSGSSGSRGSSGTSGATGANGSSGTSGAGTISGGTANYVARFTGASTLSTGVIYDDNTNVAIGKTTPINAKLDVNGNTKITGSLNVTGDITAVGNITAYFSDDRLKNNLGNIPDSLNKVLSLNGFYFEANQTAIDFGYTKQKEVGVSAQQVQAILPEIIAPAPIDPIYMAVRYEKLIPLLIEAIKEQNSMIVDLQQRINRL